MHRRGPRGLASVGNTVRLAVCAMMIFVCLFLTVSGRQPVRLPVAASVCVPMYAKLRQEPAPQRGQPGVQGGGAAWGVTGAVRARGSSGQDLGDGIWPVLAALLPRTARIQVLADTSTPTNTHLAVPGPTARLCAFCATMGTHGPGGLYSCACFRTIELWWHNPLLRPVGS